MGIRVHKVDDGWSTLVTFGPSWTDNCGNECWTDVREIVMRTRAAARRADISDYSSDPDFVRHA